MSDDGKPRLVDHPEPGFFELRLVRGGPRVPAKIVLVDGLWGAWINGDPCGDMSADPVAADGVLRIWHAGRRISEQDYQHKLNVKAWAQTHAPDHPAANAERPITLASQPPIF